MDEDFATTWFDHVFQILGNSCRGITELQGGGEWETDITPDCYYIEKYKLLRRGRNWYFRIYLD
jgi:hypothetical protein